MPFKLKLYLIGIVPTLNQYRARSELLSQSWGLVQLSIQKFGCPAKLFKLLMSILLDSNLPVQSSLRNQGFGEEIYLFGNFGLESSWNNFNHGQFGVSGYHLEQKLNFKHLSGHFEASEKFQLKLSSQNR